MMFICSGSLDYGAGNTIAELSDLQYGLLRGAVTSEFAKKLPENRSEFKPDDFHGWSECVMDDVEVEAFTRYGMEVKMKTVRGLSRGDAGPVVQHVTQISLANIGLLEVDEVTYQEDCCTDELQSLLDGGWRILCVCPPKDARRPTYILGRRRDKK
jgi:hypothetical protein